MLHKTGFHCVIIVVTVSVYALKRSTTHLRAPSATERVGTKISPIFGVLNSHIHRRIIEGSGNSNATLLAKNHREGFVKGGERIQKENL